MSLTTTTEASLQSKLVGVDPGDIVDLQGKVLGRHDGVAFYTIGQRRGLGLSSPEPLYVLELDAKLNRVVVGPVDALDKPSLIIDRCNWIPFEHLKEPIEVTAKIRYNRKAPWLWSPHLRAKGSRGSQRASTGHYPGAGL